MKIRDDIAAMLHAGHSQGHIVRTLHVATITVQRHREAISLPPHPFGAPDHASIEDAFRARTEPAPGGHVRWTGPRSSCGTPVLCHQSRNESAYRAAFRLHHGREPIGRVKPGCDRAGCVAGGHLEDQPMRARTRTTYDAIFGQVTS